jgi:Rps23 Pro-64 3,4-dihydroxylase Tpa1-like proline 4-hydroxylase|tara:strand:+ start:3113 stop:3685 length:573 start_codon:yes stop_codon:yes gene_type:complete
MNLAFNFYDDLFWIHNFLPQKTYKDMYVSFIKSRNKLDFKKTDVNWRTFKEEKNNMSESYGQFIKNKDEDNNLNNYLKTYETLLNHQSFVNFLDFELSSHLRLFKYNQHLGWHSDGAQEGRRYAATFYLNRTWQESWGAELMFKSSRGSGFIPIKGNSLVIVKTGLKHKVNPNLKKTHPRFTIQTWVNTK